MIKRAASLIIAATTAFTQLGCGDSSALTSKEDKANLDQQAAFFENNKRLILAYRKVLGCFEKEDNPAVVDQKAIDFVRDKVTHAKAKSPPPEFITFETGSAKPDIGIGFDKETLQRKIEIGSSGKVSAGILLVRKTEKTIEDLKDPKVMMIVEGQSSKSGSPAQNEILARSRGAAIGDQLRQVIPGYRVCEVEGSKTAAPGVSLSVLRMELDMN